MNEITTNDDLDLEYANLQLPEHIANKYDIQDIIRAHRAILMMSDVENKVSMGDLAKSLGYSNYNGLWYAIKRWRESGLWQILYDLFVHPIVSAQAAAELYAAKMYPVILEKMVQDALDENTSPRTRLDIGAYLNATVVTPMKEEAAKPAGIEAGYAAQLASGSNPGDGDVTVIVKPKKAKAGQVKAGVKPFRAVEPQ